MSESAINTSQNGAITAPKPGKGLVMGRRNYRLDPKRRFTIPSDWFESLGQPTHLYIMPSLSDRPCLDVLTREDIDERMRPYRNRDMFDSDAASLVSSISELITEVKVEAQNRIRVTDSHLQFAQVKGEDVVLLGADNYFEIWSVENRPPPDGRETSIVSQLRERVNLLKQQKQ